MGRKDEARRASMVEAQLEGEFIIAGEHRRVLSFLRKDEVLMQGVGVSKEKLKELVRTGQQLRFSGGKPLTNGTIDRMVTMGWLLRRPMDTSTHYYLLSPTAFAYFKWVGRKFTEALSGLKSR